MLMKNKIVGQTLKSFGRCENKSKNWLQGIVTQEYLEKKIAWILRQKCFIEEGLIRQGPVWGSDWQKDIGE